MSTSFFRYFRPLLRFLLRLFVRIDLKGLEAAPKTGGLIVAGNHLGRLDPFLVYVALDRDDIIMLVAEKYQRSALARWMVKLVDGIFVDRFNADFHALRLVLNRLKKGGILVMSPEGTRSKTGGLIEGRPGAAYLAAKSGLPVVPVAEWGGEDHQVLDRLRRLRRAEIHVRVGAAFCLPPLPKEDRELALRAYTDEIMCQIAALLPPEQRGIYARHPRLFELLGETAPALQDQLQAAPARPASP